MSESRTSMVCLADAPLGKKSSYIDTYTSSLLFPIARVNNRKNLRINTEILPFYGGDIWHAFELSWLNKKAKPVVAIARIVYPCTAPYLIESKSLKLYFNSFNNSKFANINEVEKIITKDLSAASGSEVNIEIFPVAKFPKLSITKFDGNCLDELDISCDTYTPNPEYLTTEGEEIIEEKLYSELLKSNCLCTYQPDWGTVQIIYTGKKINHAGLLKYIISFRNINDFGEHCVERIYIDIMQQCKPEKLFVYACYTRRGGIDLNPYRSSTPMEIPSMIRLLRQ